jgi:flagellin
MPAYINTNVASINTVRILDSSQKELTTSMERLSSGKRINHARDDAAGMAISSKMTSQIKGMNQAVRNTNDGISLVQTADGAMEGISDKLQRMRELAVQSANGIYSTADRAALNTEFQALDDEITRVADSAKFNDQALLNTSSGLNIQVGHLNETSSRISVSRADVSSDAMGGANKINVASIGTATASQTAITSIDAALSQVNTARASLGSTQNRLETTVKDLKNNVENLSASRSRIQDADFASETANLAKSQILQQAGMAMLAQANQLPQQVLSLLR